MGKKHKITATNFASAWQCFVKSNQEVLVSSWEDQKRYTEYILGNAEASSSNSRLGDFLNGYFQHLRYRTEEWKVDMVLTEANNVSGIEDMNYAENSHIKLVDEHFYPTHYDILIEHENNIALCYEEMLKLTYLRAKLKVLITYDYDFDSSVLTSRIDKEVVSKTIEFTVQNFSKIIKLCNASRTEQEQTEYLLIIGQRKRNKELPGIQWYYFKFDNQGEKTNLKP